MSNRWQNALPRPVAFVLSGGASQAAMQVGMLRALHAAGIEPDIVVGASAGALNGAAVAAWGLADSLDHLDDIWLQLDEDDVFYQNRLNQLASFLEDRTSIFSNDRLQATLEKIVPVDTFAALKLPFGALATDVLSREGVLFTEGDLHQALLASSALPAILPQVEINGRLYMDGAITAHIPLSGALMLDAASIVAIDVGEVCARSEAPGNIPEIVISTVHAAIRQRVHVEAPVIAEKVPLLYLPTSCAQDHDFLDFRDSSRLMDEAEELTKKFLAEADIPEAGKMSGAPHTHENQPGQIARTAVAGES